MSLSTNQIADLLLKKIGYGASDTDPTRAPFEEPHVARLAVLASQIWADAAQIPAQAPATDTSVVKKIVDLKLTVVPGTTASFTDPYLQDVIPFNFGNGSYNYVLKDSTGKVIPFGKNDWYLDPESGVLTFFGGAPASMPPSISCYKYIGTKGLSAASAQGMLVVNTLDELSPTGSTEGTYLGQLCSVLDTQELYMWTADLTVVPAIYSWAPAAGAGGSGGGTSWATVSRPGIVKMSYPAASSGTPPIAVADTDPRMANARTPRLHAKTHWDDSVNPDTNQPYATDRIPDATDLHAGLMSAQHVQDLQKAVGLPYPLDQKLRGQYVSEVFDGRGLVAGDSVLDVSAKARARGWTPSTDESTKGVMVSPFTPDDALSKVYLYDDAGAPLEDGTLGRIFGRLVFTAGDPNAVPVVDDVWELHYRYDDAVTGEQPYAWPAPPTTVHAAKLGQIFDLWDAPVFDPTLAAPGPVPSTVPTATDTTPGIATVGGNSQSAYAAAPNAHTFEGPTAHGGLVSGLQLAGEVDTTEPGVVRFLPGPNVTIERTGNDLTISADAQVANAVNATGHSLGYAQLTAEPVDPNAPLALAPNDPLVVMTDRDATFDDTVYLSAMNFQLREVGANTADELGAFVPAPKEGQLVRTISGDIYQYYQGTWKALGAAHAATHLTDGTDPIPLATKTADGLMSKEDKQAVHLKNDATALQLKKIAKLALGGSESSVSGTTLDVTARMASELPATSLLREGAVVFEPSNRVRLVDVATGTVMKDGSDEVYGRLTATITTPGTDEDPMADPPVAETPAGVSAWALSFYTLVGGTETAYSMPNKNFDWYYQRLYSLFDQPTFDTATEVPAGTALMAIGDASANAKGVAMVGGTGTEPYRAASRVQLKTHEDTGPDTAHGGVMGKITVPVQTLRAYTADPTNLKVKKSFPARDAFVLKGDVTVKAGDNVDLEPDGTGGLIIHADRGFHPDLPTTFTAPVTLTPGLFPTDGIAQGTVHVDSAGVLWVNRTGQAGGAYDAWFPAGDDPTLVAKVVGGFKNLSVGVGVTLMADGKVRMSEADDTGDHKAIGFVTAIQQDPAPAPKKLQAMPGDTVYVKIDGHLKNVPIANSANAGDYLILKGGILGKAYSVGDQPYPYAVARAAAPSVNGLVDVIIVRISAGVGAGGAAKTDEWDSESSLSADGDTVWPRMADTEGLYRFYLTKYPLETHDVRVMVGNVRQPSAKWVLKQDITGEGTNPRFGQWYVGLRFPLQLSTDAVFVDYFHA